jgi:COMPASS component SWD3
MKNSETLLSVNCDGTLSQYGTQKMKTAWKYQERGKMLLCADYKPNGKSFIVGDKEGMITLFDEETKKKTTVFEPGNSQCPGHTNRVFSVKFLRDQPQVFISGGWDNVVYFWDIRDKRPIGSYFGAKVGSDTLDEKNGVIVVG